MQRAEGRRDPDPGEVALAARAAAGDHGAFATIMRANNQALYRVARSILRDDAEAEDALQSSYLKAYVALPGFAGRSQLSTWLTRIVINECLERRRRRSRELSGEEPESQIEDRGGEPAEGARDDPEALAARAELARVIESAIDALPDPFRLVFTLRAIEGRNVDEIAADLGIPEATVRTRYHRARQILQERLKREFRAALDGVFPFAGARCDAFVAAVLARLPQSAPARIN